MLSFFFWFCFIYTKALFFLTWINLLAPKVARTPERVRFVFASFSFLYIPSRKLTYPPDKAYLKMIFLFPRWDMLVPWRVYKYIFADGIPCFFYGTKIPQKTPDFAAAVPQASSPHCGFCNITRRLAFQSHSHIYIYHIYCLYISCLCMWMFS